MNLEIPEQAKLQAALINNVGLAVAREGGDAVYTGIAMLRRAMALNPLDLGHRINLSNFLLELGHDNEAEEHATTVLKLDDKAATAWQVLGVIATHRGRLTEATDYFKRAYELDPGGQRKFDLAAAHLREGDWAQGLPLYEFRDQILPSTGPAPDAPIWKGEAVEHLHVYPDQGYGDTILFARFLPWAAERAKKVSFLVAPQLLALMYGYSKIVSVSATYAVAEKFDAQIRLSSLPLIFGCTPHNIPPDPGLIAPAATSNRLEASGLKIGIAWQGNKHFPGDSVRSIPFREFLPLASDPRNSIFSLQVGAATADIAKARAQRIVADMASQIEGEWSHTAALIKNLDLVVTSCTAIAHLAGALGVPTFVLIPGFAYWAWLSGDSTPWYPNTKLFRQTKTGEWASVMARVMAEIEQLHRSRALVAMLNRGGQAAPTLVSTGEYEPEVRALMRKVLRPGDTFFDVGANDGKHTVLAAELVGETGHVIAFEPGSNVLPELVTATKDLPQVEIVAKPACANSGPVEFHLCADGSGGNALWEPAEFPTNEKTRARPESVKLQATTLDDEISARELAVRLIKIDTEGAEQRVLQGAVELLLSDNPPPFIVAELHEFGLAKLGCSQKSLRDFMHEAGYETFVIFPDGKKPQHVPADVSIQSRMILNLLFARKDDVDKLWALEPEGDARTDGVRGWVIKDAASAA